MTQDWIEEHRLKREFVPDGVDGDYIEFLEQWRVWFGEAYEERLRIDGSLPPANADETIAMFAAFVEDE